MGLTVLDYYLIAVNIVGFMLFILNTRLVKSGSDRTIGGVLILFTFAGAAPGLFISALIFDRGGTKSKYKKDIMLLRVCIVCMLVIQTAALLMIKGFVRDEPTYDVMGFFDRHKWVLLYLSDINLITFIVFGVDKWKAVRERQRIRIVTLLTLAFIGGSVGALTGMHFFRHKTQKDYFYLGIPLMIVMQIVVVFYLMNMKI